MHLIKILNYNWIIKILSLLPSYDYLYVDEIQ